MIQPYNDEEMVFNGFKRYVLTPQALINIGINVGENTSKIINAQTALQRLLDKVSIKIYGFIHQHNDNNEIQDKLIAHIATLRPIIKEAMLIQAERILALGNLTLTMDYADKDIDADAKTVLGTCLEELCGLSILYQGRWEPWICLIS